MNEAINGILEVVLGQIPEAIYFSLFMIYAKRLKEKRVLFITLMIAEYLLLKHFIKFSIWFQIGYTIMTYLILKLLYKDKTQITDIFTFTISSILLIISSMFSFLLFRPNMILVSVINRIIIFLIIILFHKKLYKIQNSYKFLWNRNNKIKKKIKSTTFRCMNIVLFNITFYILNLGMLYMLFLRR